MVLVQRGEDEGGEGGLRGKVISTITAAAPCSTTG